MTRLKEIRKQHGLSQNEAAELVRVAQRTWARYESGERRPPPGVLELFCIKLGIDYDSTFGDRTDEKSSAPTSAWGQPAPAAIASSPNSMEAMGHVWSNGTKTTGKGTNK